MRNAATAVGSDPTARDAALAHLQAGGDSVGAIVAGFFASAGDSPGVLFGSLSLMVAQVGVGVRAFDGRQRQPGLGARRARGFLPGDPPPLAARVATPSGIPALLVALRYGRSVSLRKVVAGGIALAKQAGCERRANLLAQIERLGAAALVEPAVARPLIHLAGASEGGALSIADLSSIPELDHPARRDGLRCEVPWLGEQATAGEVEAQRDRQQALCTLDAGGGVAVLCYDQVATGLKVDALQVVLPLNAIPPVRGVPRVTPGKRLAAPAPLFIEVSEHDIPMTGGVHLGSELYAVRAADPR